MSFAPLLELPEHENSSVRYKKFIILDILDFFHAWKEIHVDNINVIIEVKVSSIASILITKLEAKI